MNPTDNLTLQIAELTAQLALNPDDADKLFDRGSLYWRLGQRQAAVGDFAAADRLCPGGRAAVMLEYARGIENFFNPDIFNP